MRRGGADPVPGMLKQKRQQALCAHLERDPFLTDEALAALLGVSVPTIRLDRAQLGLAQHRDRIKSVARRAIAAGGQSVALDPIGELLDLNLFTDGISIFVPEAGMTFDDNRTVRSCYIYAFAETLALAVIGSPPALVQIANIKYKRSVTVGSRLVAKSCVIRSRGNKYTVWVMIQENLVEVFRSKFILSVLEPEGR